MSLLNPKSKWTPSGMPIKMLYTREREFPVNKIPLNVTPAAPQPVARPRSITDREDVFNDVIAGLSVLARAIAATPHMDSDYVDGVAFALEYVRAMKAEEQ